MLKNLFVLSLITLDIIFGVANLLAGNYVTSGFVLFSAIFLFVSVYL